MHARTGRTTIGGVAQMAPHRTDILGRHARRGKPLFFNQVPGSLTDPSHPQDETSPPESPARADVTAEDQGGSQAAKQPTRRRGWIGLVAGGVLMGVADAVPGVSGGTVAMVLGFYDRLVSAISHVDLVLLRLLARRRWREAAGRIDLGFLLTLGAGVASGILVLASLMKGLLETHPILVNATFFGLVAGSTLLVMKTVDSWTLWRSVLLIVAFDAAFVLVGFPAETLEPSEDLWSLALSGSIAICAMILPGVSGAFLMKVMGEYDRIIGLLADVVHGRATADSLVTLAVFAGGCLFGLITFSKVLKRLLDRYRDATLVVLCGAMCGSLRVLWPFQDGEAVGTHVSAALLVAGGLAGVLLLDRVAGSRILDGDGDGDPDSVPTAD
mgnify:CR=1 FL=1